MEDIIMDYETEITKEDIEKNKGIAALSYLLFFLPLIFAQDSKFARFHMNQGLILLLVAVIFIFSLIANFNYVGIVTVSPRHVWLRGTLYSQIQEGLQYEWDW